MMLGDDEEESFYACFTDDSLIGANRGTSGSYAGSTASSGGGDQVYTINVPRELLAQLDLDDDTRSFISIPKAIVNHDKATISIMDEASVSIVDAPPIFHRRRLGRAAPPATSSSRRLAPSTGDNGVLILRVTYRGKQPDMSARQLQGAVFGTGPRKIDVSASSQMQACSFGQLRYHAAPDGDGIQGGVAEISINQNVGGDVRVLENLVLKKYNSMFDNQLKNSLTHVMMVFPNANLELHGGSWLGTFTGRVSEDRNVVLIQAGLLLT